MKMIYFAELPAQPSPGPANSSKPTFASALRDLAINAGDEAKRQRVVSTPGMVTPPFRAGTPVTSPGTVSSSLLDVRKVRPVLMLDMAIIFHIHSRGSDGL